MKEQIKVDPEALANDPDEESSTHDGTREIAPDLAYKRLAVVNVVFWGVPNAPDREWVLIDTGIIGQTGAILKAAERRFGPASRPAAIVMTHGHFDHVCGLKELCERWNTPVYAHSLERPYLTGQQAYDPPNPKVGGGLMALLSPMFPPNPIDVSRWLQVLPEDGTVPSMSGWRWLHTPGHTAGHISLWREADRTLIVGDAFITTNQESAYAVATQKPELHGPPMYYTPDWQNARSSVEKLAALEPNLVISGHGRAMQGPKLREALHALAEHFDEVAVPGVVKAENQ